MKVQTIDVKINFLFTESNFYQNAKQYNQQIRPKEAAYFIGYIFYIFHRKSIVRLYS